MERWYLTEELELIQDGEKDEPEKFGYLNLCLRPANSKAQAMEYAECRKKWLSTFECDTDYETNDSKGLGRLLMHGISEATEIGEVIENGQYVMTFDLSFSSEEDLQKYMDSENDYDHVYFHSTPVQEGQS